MGAGGGEVGETKNVSVLTLKGGEWEKGRRKGARGRRRGDVDFISNPPPG